MATITITNHIAKWYSNKTSWTKMTWWKTSFNMPVKDIFDNNSNYTETEWMLNSIWEDTNFNLTWFQVWWEAISWSSVYTIYWPFTWWDVLCKQEWKRPNWDIMFTNQATVNFSSIASWSWISYQLASNQWVASWEINWNWTYQLVATASWAITWSTTTDITISNCPNTSTTYTPWYIWVEWNDLRWTSANWHIHTRNWTYISNPWATAWYIWIEWNNFCWIWWNWYKYKWPYNFKQFGSVFSNWPNPWVVSWQTPWYIWMDNNFWYEHIWYIANDWYKRIFNSWENPYA